MSTTKNIISALNEESKQALLTSVLNGELLQLLDPRKQPMKHQTVPKEHWDIFFLNGGRASGKTYAQAFWVAKAMINNPGCTVGYVTIDNRDARNFLDLVSSLIDQTYTPKVRNVTRDLTIDNGSTLKAHIASEGLRGTTHDYLAVARFEALNHRHDFQRLYEEISMSAQRGGKVTPIFYEGDLRKHNQFLGLLKDLAVCEDGPIVRIRNIQNTDNKHLSEEYLRNLAKHNLLDQ